MATTKISKKVIDYYLNLPWSYTIETTQEDGATIYIVCVNELPGICTDAPTITAAMDLIKESMAAVFRLYLEGGEEIPVPVDEKKYRGNIAYRTTSRRHYLIARQAQLKKASLNSVIDACIDQALKRN